MRVVVLRNSISGRGHAGRHVEGLLRALANAGHEATVLDVQRGVARDPALEAALQSTDALIIAGGDGTVHHTLPLLMGSDIPVVHFPVGTENLFAREFGHARTTDSVLRSLDRRSSRRVDIGLCNDRPFTLMGSVGFDACIVARIAAVRNGAISHATYLRHGFTEFFRHSFVPVCVQVDGHDLVRDRPGMILVANSRQYAARLDPARAASMTDGSLDVVFLPMASRLGILRRGLQVLAGGHLRDKHVLTARGRDIQIRPAATVPLQLDGEHAGMLPAASEMRFAIRPAALTVFAD